MMKKLSIISALSIAAIVIAGCGRDKRDPGSIYMPDMFESRAYETYSDHSNLASGGIHYNNMPVAGTVGRGSELPYHLPNDTTGYNQSANYPNPLQKLSQVDMEEASRLYLINCGICHGAKLDGNGPLYNGGNGPYAAKPATLVGDPVIEAKSEGMYFHVQTYGKGQMGSYASQLTKRQRWMISTYIKAQQKGGAIQNPPPAVPQGDTTQSVKK